MRHDPPPKARFIMKYTGTGGVCMGKEQQNQREELFILTATMNTAKVKLFNLEHNCEQ